MADITDDRWTCPFCHHTETTAATTEHARRRAIRGFQHKHTRQHEAALAAASDTGAQP